MNDLQKRTKRVRRCMAAALLCICMAMTLVPVELYGVSIPAPNDNTPREILSFSNLPIEISEQFAEIGTPQRDLYLPETLEAVCRDLSPQPEQQPDTETEVPSTEPSSEEASETDTQDVPDTDTPGEDPANPDTDTPSEDPATPDTDTPGEDPANPDTNPPGEDPANPDTDTPGEEPANPDAGASNDTPEPPADTPASEVPEIPDDAPANEKPESEPSIINEESVTATSTDVTIKENYAEPDAPAQFQPLANETTETISVPVMFWSSSPAYDSELEGTYQFTPVLPDCYTLAEGITPPVISVTIDGGGLYALSDTEEIEDETPTSPACGTVSRDVTWESGELPDGELIILPGVTLTITGTLTIDGNVTISGGGKIARGNENAQLFVRTGKALTVQGVTIDGANISSALSMIMILKSTVTLNDGCKIQNCVKTVTPNGSGNAMWNGLQGGAALFIDRQGQASLNNVEITNCSSTVKGGAIYTKNSTVTIQGGTYSGNSTTCEAPVDGTGGGFLYNDTSTVTIEGGSFLNNKSTGEGGCIYHGGNGGTNTHLHGGVFSGNISTYSGKEGSGAIWNSAISKGTTKLTLSGSVQFAGDGGASGMDGIYLDKSDNGNEEADRRVYIRNTLSFPIRIYVEAEEDYVIAEGAKSADGSAYTLLEERDMKKIKFIDAGSSGKNWYAKLDKENNQVRIVSTDPGYGFFVDYDNNGATGPVIKDRNEYNATKGLTATILGADGLSKEGEFFYKWNTQSNGKGDDYDPGDTITLTDDLKLYAIFRAHYTGTFYSGDEGNAPEVITADPGTARIEVPRLKSLKKTEGYTTVGWSKTKEPDDPGTAEGIKPSQRITLADDTSFYGIYEKNVTLTFLPGTDGVSLTPATKDGINYCISHEDGVTYRRHEFELNPEITREGYTCVGWMDENDTFYDYGITKTFEEDTVLTACWLANNETIYHVEYYKQNVENDEYTLDKTLTRVAETGSTATVPKQEQEQYYGFTLNETDSTISGTVTPNGSLTLRLYYDRNTANISFNLGKAPGNPPAAQQVRYGAALQPVADPSWPDCWSFGGWYKNEEATVDSRWDFNKTAADNGVPFGDAILYANWYDDIDPEFADPEAIVYSEVYTNLLNWIIGKKNLQISIPVTEKGSGIDDKNTTYTLEPDNATEAQKRSAVSIPANVDLDTNTIHISITEDFKGKIQVTCYDNAGNHSSMSLTADDGGIIVEDSAPEISFSDASGKNIISSDPYYDSAKINVTVEDEVKDEAGEQAVSGGITKISYWVDDGEKQTPPGASEEELENAIITDCFFDVTIDANIYGYGKHTLYVEAADRVGNISENNCSFELLRRNRKYLVKHFTMNTDCQTYTEEESERQEFEDFIGETVTADPKSYAGFFDNASHPERVPSGVVVDSETEPLELKFYYDRNIYNISYDLNGASGTAPSGQAARYGVPTPEPVSPERAGYTFKGWYLDAAGTESGKWDFSLPPEANMTAETVTTDPGAAETSVTLYAKWADEIAPVLGEATYNQGYRRLLDYIIRKPDLLITVPITEEGSGVAEASYILMPDDGSLQEGKAAIETKNGQTVAQFYIREDFSGSVVLSASDNAGNMSAEKLLTSENGGIIVEDSAPEITFSSKDGKLSDVFDKDVTIDVSVKDISSRRKVSGGIASVTYQIDDEKTGSPKEDFTKEITKSVDFSVRIKNEGTHRLSVTATDNVGHKTTRQVKIKIQADTPAFVPVSATGADAPAQTGSEPQTGDSSRVWLYAAIAMLAGLFYLLLLFGPRRAPMGKDDMQKKIRSLVRWSNAGGAFRKPVAMTAVFFLVAYYNIVRKLAKEERKDAYEP